MDGHGPAPLGVVASCSPLALGLDFPRILGDQDDPRVDSSPSLEDSWKKSPGSPGIWQGLEWDLSIPFIPNHSMIPRPLKRLLLQGAGNDGWVQPPKKSEDNSFPFPQEPQFPMFPNSPCDLGFPGIPCDKLGDLG